MLDMELLIQIASDIVEDINDKVEGHPTTYDEAILTYLTIERLIHDRVIDLEYERID